MFCPVGSHVTINISITIFNVGDIKIVMWGAAGKNTTDVVKLTYYYLILAAYLLESPDDGIIN